MTAPTQELSGAAAEGLPILRTQQWHASLTPELLEQVAELLPGFIVSRRWFRAKARSVASIRIEDVVPFAEHDSWLLVLDILYDEGESDTYLLPVSLTPQEEAGLTSFEKAEPLAKFHSSDGRQGVMYSAFANPRFRSLLLTAIGQNQTFEGSQGTLAATRTEAPGGEVKLDDNLDSFVSGAEQSNTSIIFGDQFILKLFRKVEEGINPDIEVAKFLTEHRFDNTPAVLGTLEYRSKRHNGVYAAGILQRFVRNQGDAWKYTLEALSGFFQRALSNGLAGDEEAGLHPLELMSEPVPDNVRSLIGGYFDSASLLGRRTAEMHAVLATATADADFVAESFTSQDAEQLRREMAAQADTAFNVLRLKQPTLTGEAAANAQELLAFETAVRDRILQLQNADITAQRIRFHGDYHLGQVLVTSDDFMIIDFEGEPARPLQERRGKTICLRDVAGMLRSFQYAGYASLFGQVTGVSTGDPKAIEQAAALWNSWVAAAYLKGYFEAAGNAAFLPQTTRERRFLLDAFLLHKALYEVAYELNNRPDWVVIPLRGILDLIR